ncbi:hypothetical protein [Salibacterium aidingense]|uniref:hypothetical protein n=1 Tax=Salibacterium aidingense TaxID=384933 RepID=UPI003BEC03CE
MNETGMREEHEAKTPQNESSKVFEVAGAARGRTNWCHFLFIVLAPCCYPKKELSLADFYYYGAAGRLENIPWQKGSSFD